MPKASKSLKWSFLTQFRARGQAVNPQGSGDRELLDPWGQSLEASRVGCGDTVLPASLTLDLKCNALGDDGMRALANFGGSRKLTDAQGPSRPSMSQSPQ